SSIFPPPSAFTSGRCRSWGGTPGSGDAVDRASVPAAMVGAASAARFPFVGDYRWLPGYASCRTTEPVSSRDFRLHRIFGQQPDTASISFEGSRSMVWVMESLTAVPLGSNSIVQRDSPSALSSGLL